MKKEIKQWKMENGNSVTYTTKELIQGLHVKIDKINDRVVCKDSCNRKSNNLRNMVIGMFSLLFTLLGGLASYVFFG